MATGSGTPVHDLWAAKRPAFGGWCVIPSPFSAEVLAQRGFDWVGIDWQHGFIDYETTAGMIQAISIGGSAPLVRVNFNEAWIIMKALDMGAHGVIVPLVNTRTEAERAVAACRYPPIGGRSFGPVRNSRVIGVETDGANERALCFVMIETREGFENVDAISATPGLTGVFIGPDDLRLSLGAPKGDPDPAVIETVLNACRANEIVCGIHTGDGDDARRRGEQGYGLIAIGSDADFLAESADSAVSTARPGGRGRAEAHNGDLTARAVVWSGL
jgi:4-hydroxy-2-oxoheptanedioate aldolase